MFDGAVDPWLEIYRPETAYKLKALGGETYNSPLPTTSRESTTTVVDRVYRCVYIYIYIFVQVLIQKSIGRSVCLSVCLSV